MSKRSINALFLASLMSFSVLLSSCSAVKTDDSQETLTAPPASEPPVVTSHDPNVPDNLLGSETPSNSSEPPVESSTEPSSSEQQTEPSGSDNHSGMIVDDWSENLDLSKNDPAAIYDSYGIDKSLRDGFYTKICSETEFPVIHISTKNNAEILSRDEYVDCFVEVMNCDTVYQLEASEGGIRVRGNASANYGNVDWIRQNPVSYRIKFNEKQSMLGLNDFAKCRSWVLLKPYETAIRNHLAFRLAKAINNGDYYTSDSIFVQLYINEEYLGPYQLCEQTQENSNRVDINEAPEGYTGTDIGYLVELDNYATSDDDPYFFLNFNLEEITDAYGTSRVPRKYSYSVKNDLYSDEQLKFIERYFEVAYEIALRAIKYGEFYTYDENYDLVPAQDMFSSAYECVNAVFDVNSVVDMYILYEIVNDQDLGGGSFFFAVDFGEDPKYERLTMVAPWDFDWGYTDNNSKADGGLYAAKFKDSYFIDTLNLGDRSNPWLILFYSADWFKELVRQKWKARLDSINAALDEVEDLVVNYSDEFNKDGERRSGRAKTTLDWTRDRVEYLGTIWG